MNVRDTRKDYQRDRLLWAEAPVHPMPLITSWLETAAEKDPEDFNAFVLSTANAQGRPSARVVLARAIDEEGIQFFTNHKSQKGKELLANPFGAATFFWKDLERQLRVVGAVLPLSPEESDAYFASRPRGSQIGAWASAQSEPLAQNPDALQDSYAAWTKRFEGEDTIPRPSHWGGFQLSLDAVEFWQGRPSRMHDRLRYSRKDRQSPWKLEVLNP